jgi:hypothetical protein
MKRRGFIAALTALVIGGTIGKLVDAQAEHRQLATGGPIPQGQWYYVGEQSSGQIRFNVRTSDAEHFRQILRHHNARRGIARSFAQNIKRNG